MRPLRRTDHAPRVEFTPLIDVIFLLLTFFVYSLLTLVRAEVLPVRLTPVRAGTPSTQRATLPHTLTIDRAGALYLDRVAVTLDQLPDRLRTLARTDDPGTLYLALEERGTADRGPLLIELIQMAQSAGLRDVAIVGRPAQGDSP